ncbi:MAG: hypothetical protein K8S16_11005 [Bacteroidales bacterium]|nr:hypothetical protein [Bacteroidales bacterium]
MQIKKNRSNNAARTIAATRCVALKKRTMKIILTTFHLLIFSALFGQSLCDTTTEPNVFVYLEQMPSSNITFGQLEKMISESIDLMNYNLSEGDTFYISFLINCKGEDFNYKISNLENEDLKRSLKKIFKENLDWDQPIHHYKTAQGKEVEKPVDFKKNLKLIIENNQIYITDPNTKTKKGKRK